MKNHVNMGSLRRVQRGNVKFDLPALPALTPLVHGQDKFEDGHSVMMEELNGIYRVRRRNDAQCPILKTEPSKSRYRFVLNRNPAVRFGKLPKEPIVDTLLRNQDDLAFTLTEMIKILEALPQERQWPLISKVLPHLINCCVEMKDDHVISAVMVWHPVLPKIHQSHVTLLLIGKAIESPDPLQRKRAVQSLERIIPLKDEQVSVEDCDDDQPHMPAQALTLMILEKCVEDPDESVRTVALRWIVGTIPRSPLDYGLSYIKILLDWKAAPDSPNQRTARYGIKRILDALSGENLLSLFKDNNIGYDLLENADPDIRMAALRCLGRAFPQAEPADRLGYAEKISEGLKGSNVDDQIAAIDELAKALDYLPENDRLTFLGKILEGLRNPHWKIRKKSETVLTTLKLSDTERDAFLQFISQARLPDSHIFRLTGRRLTRPFVDPEIAFNSNIARILQLGSGKNLLESAVAYTKQKFDGKVNPPGYDSYTNARPLATKFTDHEKILEEGGYWAAYGDQGKLSGTIGRFYLSVRGSYAEEYLDAIKQIRSEASRQGARMIFKLPIELQEYKRADTSVVYFEAANEAWFYERAIQLVLNYPLWFAENSPLFTAQVLDKDGIPVVGLSYGMDPPAGNSSFGLFIAKLVHQIAIELCRCYPSGRLDDKTIFDFFRDGFKRHGIDPDKPYFMKLADGRLGHDLFPVIDRYSAFMEPIIHQS